MPGIFDDEWAACGQIPSNPLGTRPISLLDGDGNRLKWLALRRVCPIMLSGTTRNEMGHAGT